MEFFGQRKATVKTNNTTLQLPVLNTKAKITPLMARNGLNETAWNRTKRNNRHYQNK